MTDAQGTAPMRSPHAPDAPGESGARSWEGWRRIEPGALTLWLLAALALAYLIAPLIQLLLAEPWPQVPAALADPQALGAARVSAQAATITTALVALGGVPLAYALARWRFPLRPLVTGLIFTPLVFPAVVSGIVQLLVYGPYGPVGAFFVARGVELTDSLAGVVLAQSFVAAPFAVVAARSAFEAVNPLTEAVAQTLGASRWRVFWTISLPQAWSGVLAGLALTWLRAFGEFGATTVLAYHPYTLPVYIYVQLTGLGTPAALPLALVALAACAVVITIALLLTRSPHPAGGRP